MTNYNGDYDAYVYSVNKEIDDGEREAAQNRMARPPAEVLAPKSTTKAKGKDDRAMRKEVSSLEKTIARLDEQKKLKQQELLNSTDASAALRIHNEVEALSAQLTEAEDRWCSLQQELGEF